MVNSQDHFDRIFEIAIDDILEATDEEILQEAVEDGFVIENEVKSMKRIFNRCCYNIAKSSTSKKESTGRACSAKILDISTARNKINEVIRNSPDILMAARFGEDVPDEDVLAYYEALSELGVLKEK